MTAIALADRPHALYRFYGANGALLYVGMTADPGARWKTHSKGKSWWHNVAQVRVEHFLDRTSAEVAERRAIRSEHPRHNVQHAQRVSATGWRRHVILHSSRNLLPELDEAGEEIVGGVPATRSILQFRRDMRFSPFARKIVIDRDEAAHVQLDRDGYLQREYGDWLPSQVISAAHRCAKTGLRRISGQGHWVGRSIPLSANDHWVSIFVPLRLINDAADALVHAELARDAEPLLRLATNLEDGPVR